MFQIFSSILRLVFRIFRLKNDQGLDRLVGGATNIGTWLCGLMLITQGGCIQGSPSICIGNRFLVLEIVQHEKATLTLNGENGK